ncbi:MAG: hypothetical protein DWQ31_15820 [Planctomycetota bacterium]|nr:MAG: hypothetical protein DWQ31_15820 [Planctomycetota bacterium]
MFFGLTFMAIANSKSSQQRWRDEARARSERMDRHQRLSWLADDHLDADERALLDDLTAQIEADDPPHAARDCPECGRPFVLVRLRGVQLDCCARCRGIWFDPGELKLISEVDSEVPQTQKAMRPSRHACPDCGEVMIEYALFNPLNLLVDRCPRGHGVYLEDRELERVFQIS